MGRLRILSWPGVSLQGLLSTIIAKDCCVLCIFSRCSVAKVHSTKGHSCTGSVCTSLWVHGQCVNNIQLVWLWSVKVTGLCLLPMELDIRVPTRLCSESLPYGTVDHCVSTVSRGCAVRKCGEGTQREWGPSVSL